MWRRWSVPRVRVRFQPTFVLLNYSQCFKWRVQGLHFSFSSWLVTPAALLTGRMTFRSHCTRKCLRKTLGLQKGCGSSGRMHPAGACRIQSNHTYIFLDKVALLCCGLPWWECACFFYRFTSHVQYARDTNRWTHFPVSPLPTPIMQRRLCSVYGFDSNRMPCNQRRPLAVGRAAWNLRHLFRRESDAREAEREDGCHPDGAWNVRSIRIFMVWICTFSSVDTFFLYCTFAQLWTNHCFHLLIHNDMWHAGAWLH